MGGEVVGGALLLVVLSELGKLGALRTEPVGIKRGEREIAAERVGDEEVFGAGVLRAGGGEVDAGGLERLDEQLANACIEDLLGGAESEDGVGETPVHEIAFEVAIAEGSVAGDVGQVSGLGAGDPLILPIAAGVVGIRLRAVGSGGADVELEFDGAGELRILGDEAAALDGVDDGPPVDFFEDDGDVRAAGDLIAVDEGSRSAPVVGGGPDGLLHVSEVGGLSVDGEGALGVDAAEGSDGALVDVAADGFAELGGVACADLVDAVHIEDMDGLGCGGGAGESASAQGVVSGGVTGVDRVADGLGAGEGSGCGGILGTRGDGGEEEGEDEEGPGHGNRVQGAGNRLQVAGNGLRVTGNRLRVTGSSGRTGVLCQPTMIPVFCNS